MTEEQLKAYRANCQIEAYSNVLRTLCAGLEQLLPGVGKPLLESTRLNCERIRQSLVFDNYTPAESDMYAAEYQEAFDRVLREMQSAFEGPTKSA